MPRRPPRPLVAAASIGPRAAVVGALSLVGLALSGCCSFSENVTTTPGALGEYVRGAAYVLKEDALLVHLSSDLLNRSGQRLMTEQQVVEGLPDDERRRLRVLGQVPRGTRVSPTAVKLYACPDFNDTIVIATVLDGPFKAERVKLDHLSRAIDDRTTGINPQRPSERYLELAD